MEQKQRFIFEGREYKTAAHHRAMIMMRQRIGQAQADSAKLADALRVGVDRGLCARAAAEVWGAGDEQKWLLTSTQVDALSAVQVVCGEMVMAMQAANAQNVSFGLGLPPLQLAELTAYLAALDGRIGRARQAAARMGVAAVTEDLSRLKETAAVLKKIRKAVHGV